MIANIGPEPNGFTPLTQELPKELIETIARATADGTTAAVLKFQGVNNINVTPGTNCENPLMVFTMKLTAEFAKNSTSEEHRKFAKVYPYPFKQSIKKRIEKALDEAKVILFQLWQAGEKDNLERLCRVIGCGEALKFLEERRPLVIKLIARIRGNDIVKIDPNSPVQ